jgi:KDO2-lipid IV(A) lauroyltransferase
MRNFKLRTIFHLLSPQYWPAWFLLGVLWLVALFPHRISIRIGKLLGQFLFLLPTQMKQTTKTNLTLCFPELSYAEREALAKKNFISLGIAFIESAKAWWLPEHRLKNLCQIQGGEHLQAALQKGKGVILIAPHFTCLELVGRLLGQSYTFGVMYRVHKKPFISMLHALFRKKHYNTYIPSHQVRKLIRALNDNLPIWYAYDIDAGSKRNSVFAPFFEIETATLTTVSRIVKLTDAVVLPFNYFRSENNLNYEVIISPPLENFPGKNVLEDATRLNNILENAIRQHPEQYVWQYKRFKTRPHGQKRFYFSNR